MTKSKQLKAYEALEIAKSLDQNLERPWDVTTCAGLEMSLFGDQIMLGKDSDYLSLAQARQVAVYLADQLGGTVKWNKGSK